MIIRRTCRFLLYACTLVCGLALPPAAQADFIVSVDTSSINGSQGFIDIQFNPGPGSPGTTATVTNFSTDATLLPFITVSGVDVYAGTDNDASGTLPGTLTISNVGSQFNDVYQPVTYGTYISFDVAFSEPPTGGSFGLTLYANDFATPLLVDNNGNPFINSNPPDPASSLIGTVVAINLNSDGSATTLTFADPSNPDFDPNNPNSPSDGGVTPQVSTPEPSTWLLLSIGAAGVWTMRKRMGIMPIS